MICVPFSHKFLPLLTENSFFGIFNIWFPLTKMVVTFLKMAIAEMKERHKNYLSICII